MNTRSRPRIAALTMLYLSTLAVILAACGRSVETISGTPAPPATLSSIAVTPASPSIAPGTTIQLTATGTYSNNAKLNLSFSATWSSSDTGVATVSNRGLVTAATTGTAVITATSGTISGSATLTTSSVATISISPSTPPSIAPGTTQQFFAVGTLANSMVQNLTTFATWTSSDTAIASVSGGLASAIS